ncbi:hypothetical protein IAU59_006440 [Kwoniella sp. CBS 9459]
MFSFRSSGGGGGGGSGGHAVGVQMELAALKSAPVLNPHFGMVIKYLDCLNRLADQLLASSRGAGMAAWLVEVQHLIKLLQKRTFNRMPLTPVERSSIISFANYWRRMVQPPYDMGRPEAQLVLITLTEFATH